MRRLEVTIVDNGKEIDIRLDAEAEPSVGTPAENDAAKLIGIGIRELLRNPRRCMGYGEGRTFEDAKTRLDIDRDIRKAGES